MQDKCRNCGSIWLNGHLVLHIVKNKAQLGPCCEDCGNLIDQYGDNFSITLDNREGIEIDLNDLYKFVSSQSV